MALTDVTTLGKRVQQLDIGKETYYAGVIGRVESEDDEEIVYEAGDTSGKNGLVLEFTSPWITQDIVNDLFTRIQGNRYFPYSADAALLDPASEMGDAVSVSDVYSMISRRRITFSALMAADISSPSDEEIDHEYPYVSKTDRKYRREVGMTRTRISQNAESIMLEAETARGNEARLNTTITQTAAEIRQEASASNAQLRQDFNSSLSQTAQSIRADVVAKQDGNRSSFGWILTSTGWEVYSNNSAILKATSSGLEVTGNITATGGKIGGFTLGSNAMTYNGQTWNGSVAQGIYIGQSGIQLGTKFKVTNQGKVTASDLTITGGSISIKNSSGEDTFVVTNRGALTAVSGTIAGFKLAKTSMEKAGAVPTDYTSAKTRYGFKINTPEEPTSSNTAFSIWKTVYTPNKNKTAWSSTETTTIFTVGYNGKLTSIGAVSLANGNFTVDESGNVIANNMTLKGQLRMQNANGENEQRISADTLADYARHSYNETTSGGYCYTGAGYGNNYNTACSTSNDGPSVFSCQKIRVNHEEFSGGVQIRDYSGRYYYVLGYRAE